MWSGRHRAVLWNLQLFYRIPSKLFCLSSFLPIVSCPWGRSGTPSSQIPWVHISLPKEEVERNRKEGGPPLLCINLQSQPITEQQASSALQAPGRIVKLCGIAQLHGTPSSGLFQNGTSWPKEVFIRHFQIMGKSTNIKLSVCGQFTKRKNMPKSVV